jgi:hypothetical protein
MNAIDAAHEVLQQVPARFDAGGKAAIDATAYYVDVPVESLPPSCKLTKTEFGYNIEGQLDDCTYRGQAYEGSQNGKFRRVMLSFVTLTPASTLH